MELRRLEESKRKGCQQSDPKKNGGRMDNSVKDRECLHGNLRTMKDKSRSRGQVAAHTRE